MVGTATEFIAGQPTAAPCYGTFAGDLQDQAFRFRISFVEHTGHFAMHSHEYAELVLVLAGTSTHLTYVENHALEAGDVFVISAGRSHGFDRAQGLRLCNIMFDPAQFLEGERELEGLMGYQALFHIGPRLTEPALFRERMHLATEELSHANLLLSALKNEYENKGDGWTASVRYQFLSLVTMLSRAYTQQKREQATPLIQMARVVSHIQQNFHETISVEDLARLAHLSPSQFQRRFKQIYNVTPMQFVTNVRIQTACEMLRNPNHDVTRVALATGFSTSAFFSAQFKRHMGESPSSYRKRRLASLQNNETEEVS
jgi:AraC family L-rhamnose operon transcriptional activator RhaR/AraC family L-rhamnose operon regulatory protein RhaS